MSIGPQLTGKAYYEIGGENRNCMNCGCPRKLERIVIDKEGLERCSMHLQYDLTAPWHADLFRTDEGKWWIYVCYGCYLEISNSTDP